MDHKELIARMTLDEKISLCSGRDYWHTKPVPHLGVPFFTMSDGPHGLRKQNEGTDNLGIIDGEEATCFPPACLTACSFDTELVGEMGEAIGVEASSKDVHIVLGPGVNIKRDPLCGRNFEYFSEDPYLAGEMGKAWIEGIQKTGVGACLKHFACNNQEDLRMSSDSMVDARALYEVYLPAFKKSLEAHPAAVMCAYNKVGGEYMSDNEKMVRGILREKWGYRGLVMTDWGGMNDRVKAFLAGVDLEMPGSGGFFDAKVKQAVRQGHLPEERINECAGRVLEAAFQLNKNKQNLSYDIKEHHILAKKIAAESAVLLRNEGILPIAGSARIAVVGGLARKLRYQGSGSSHIKPHMISSLLDGLNELNVEYAYYKGYPLNNSINKTLVQEALEGCRGCDAVIIAAGLTEKYEAEGFDRRNMKIPEAQNELIERIAQVNPNVVVVLFGGAPMELPWVQKVKGLLHMYLPGQAGGLAAAELLLGIKNPSGKLAESYPLRYEDAPAAGFYGKTGKQAQYRESVFTGYRYYDKLDREVLFPFGFGLSYTKFEYTGMELSQKRIAPGEGTECAVSLRNTGGAAGAEIVQVYVSKPVSGPVRELAGFAKVFLETGEEKTAKIRLKPEVFLTFDEKTEDFVMAAGEYIICAGSSSRDLRILDSICAEGAAAPESGIDEYIKGELTQQAFEGVLKRSIHPETCNRRGCFTRENTLAEMKDIWISRLIVWYARRRLKRKNKLHKDHPLFFMMIDVLVNMPVGRFPLMGWDKMPDWVIRLLLNIENKRFWFAGEKNTEAGS